jgi:lysophospholipase L1-like esterase
MMTGVLKASLLLVGLLAGAKLIAQQFPFYDEIREFRKEDSLHKPRPNSILFVGSSSFRKWTDVQDYFPGYPIINRGFGGSSIPDVIRYQDDVIFKYHPKQIVFYCGENDFAASDTVSVTTVVNRFTTLFTTIRQRLPGVPFVFVSIKPSPSRIHLRSKFEEANKQIKRFLSHQTHTVFVDVFPLMLDANGQPRKELFLEDMLHMKPEGYRIWQRALMPHLIKNKVPHS